MTFFEVISPIYCRALLKYRYIIDSIGNSGPKQLRLLPRPQHPRRRQCLLV